MLEVSMEGYVKILKKLTMIFERFPWKSGQNLKEINIKI